MMLDPLAERATLEQARWWMRQGARRRGRPACPGVAHPRQDAGPSGITPAAAATETRRLVRLGQALGPGSHGEEVVWESLAVSNLRSGARRSTAATPGTRWARSGGRWP